MDYLHVQVDNMVELFYTTYISVDLAHHEIFRDEVGKGGINGLNQYKTEDKVSCSRTQNSSISLAGHSTTEKLRSSKSKFLIILPPIIHMGDSSKILNS